MASLPTAPNAPDELYASEVGKQRSSNGLDQPVPKLLFQIEQGLKLLAKVLGQDAAGELDEIAQRLREIALRPQEDADAGGFGTSGVNSPSGPY